MYVIYRTPGIHRYQEFSRREYLLDARDTYDVLDLEVRSGSKDAGYVAQYSYLGVVQIH